LWVDTPCMENTTKKKPVGELLIQEELITKEQLQEILENQEKKKTYEPIGLLCVSAGYISELQLKRVLKKYNKCILLGELFLNLQVLTQSDLDIALKQQKETGKKLGEVLVEIGMISEIVLVDALSLQLGIPKIIPSVSLIQKELLEKFNPDFLSKHQFIPAYKNDDVLTVITSDPLNQEAIDFLAKVLKTKLNVAIAPASEIQKTIRYCYQKLEMGAESTPDDEEKNLIIGDKSLLESGADSIVEAVNFIISNAIMDRATDIHIEPADQLLRVRYRIDGMMHHKTDLPLHLSVKLISRIKAICGLDIAEKRKHQDGRIKATIMNKDFDLRVSTYAAIFGENVVIRIQNKNSDIVDVTRIGLTPANLQKYMTMLDHPSGVILVTGPTGSGKSTTLYASLQYLNKMDRVIITVEDPVEYTLDGVIQAGIPPKVGISYMDYIKAMMRQDPDVLMIGEIREQEGAEAVIQAALTGHKVLSTFHTENATGALLRLMDMGIETFLISSTLVSVVAQRLLRRLCEHCKRPYKPELKTLSFFGTLKTETFDDYQFYAPRGCIHCGGSGYRGMTGIHEVLVVNDEIRNEILDRSTSSVIKNVAREEANLVTMSEDGFYKAITGITSLAEVIRVVYHDETEGVKKLSLEELVQRCENVETTAILEVNAAEKETVA